MNQESIFKVTLISLLVLMQKSRRIIQPSSFKAPSILAEELTLKKNFGTLASSVISYDFRLTCQVFF